jgi:hypothetical protein
MEVGLRTTKDTALVIAVNHDPGTNTGGVTVRDLGFKPALACDLRTMQPVAFTPRSDGALLEVTLPGRSTAMVALYPGRPQAVRLRVQPGAGRRNTEVNCELVLPGQTGCQLVEVTVSDGQGRPIPWLARAVATEGGRARFTLPVALNEPTGRHGVTARLPETGGKAEASYTVRD